MCNDQTVRKKRKDKLTVKEKKRSNVQCKKALTAKVLSY